EHAEYDESNTYVLERFNTTARNLVKEILLKLNLPDHRSILTDSKEYLKMVMEVPDSSWEFEILCHRPLTLPIISKKFMKSSSTC
ncbi:hypothetical protein Tco_1498640, partial [Tanacetum coccineum]